MVETDCHALNDRFITRMENEYMKSDYLDSMPFPEFLWSFKDRMFEKWEAENGKN